MKLHALFTRCLHIPYSRAENTADYAVERIGRTLYLYFEGSDGAEDWKNNLDFPVRLNRRGHASPFFVHRGFLRVWNSIQPYLADAVADRTLDKIVSAGYSHGAALAVLCHEFIWISRPELRHAIEGYGFGCPRILWGYIPRAVKQRWEHFTVIRNVDDIVTHAPPAILGYRHAGALLEIGEKGKYSAIDAHRDENILTELKKYEDALPKAEHQITYTA